MPILDPAALLLVAVGTLAIVAFPLWWLRASHDRGPRRDAIAPDLNAVGVGDPARQILDRAARLDGAELRELERGYRRLNRYQLGGSEKRLLELVDGFFALLQPVARDSRFIPALRTSELRARQVVGDAREQALLAGAATAIARAPGRAARRSSWWLTRAVADAAIAVEAGDRLAADDRAMLVWPWREAVEHESTIRDPGTVVPRRLSIIVGGAALLFAALLIVSGSPPAEAAIVAIVLGLPGAFVIAAVALFRLLVWQPILRVPPGSADVSAERGGSHFESPTRYRRPGQAQHGAGKPSLMPRRLAVPVVGVAVLFAALSVAGGSTPADAAIVFGFLAALVIAAVALVRLVVWRPIVRRLARRQP